MPHRFRTGDTVVVRNEEVDGHVRTPGYLRGKRGVIVGDFGAWPNPEGLAYGSDGRPLRVNYWVRFDMDELWAGRGDYADNDSVVAEIYEQWLEPARAPATETDR